MANTHDLKQATDETLPVDAVLFGADSMTADTPSTYPLTKLGQSFLAPRKLDVVTYLAQPGAVVAHRTGGALYAPENSLAAARAMIMAGVECIEYDVYQTTTGLLVCNHDSTVDRTTVVTGNTVDLTEATLDAAIMDAAAVLGLTGSWARERLPLWHEVLREFGNRIMILVEAKNDNAYKGILAQLRRLGVDPAGVVVQSFSLTVAQAVATRGYNACYLIDDPAAVDFAAVSASGVRMMAADLINWTGTLVTAAKSAGLIVGAYTISRRYKRDAWLAMGGQFYFADDPLYLDTSNQITARDEFGAQTWPPGQLSNGATRGTMVAPDQYRMNRTSTAGYASSLAGWLCPLGNNALIDNFVLTFKLKLVSVDAADRWAGLVICAVDDLEYTDTSPWLNGYHVLLRQDGRIQLYRITAASGATLLTTQTGTAITTGVEQSITITITPTNVTVANATAGTTMTFADATRRGGYVHLGANGADARFYDIVAT